jgi:transposase-like protein
VQSTKFEQALLTQVQTTIAQLIEDVFRENHFESSTNMQEAFDSTVAQLASKLVTILPIAEATKLVYNLQTQLNEKQDKGSALISSENTPTGLRDKRLEAQASM